jgi:hypothetical protein
LPVPVPSKTKKISHHPAWREGGVVHPCQLTWWPKEEDPLDTLRGDALIVEVGELEGVRDALPQGLLHVGQAPYHAVGDANVLGGDHVGHERALVPVLRQGHHLLPGSRHGDPRARDVGLTDYGQGRLEGGERQEELGTVLRGDLREGPLAHVHLHRRHEHLGHVAGPLERGLVQQRVGPP